MPGSITLSIELELGWGMHDMDDFSHLSDTRHQEEVALSRLLDSCDENDLQISFDVVGHLFEEECIGRHDGPYPDDWWKNDPGTEHQRNPQFYAPVLVRNIINDAIDHEICTHTYSHILTEEMSNDVLHFELSKVEQIHGEWGLPSPESIVMPRHQDVDYSILKEFGIKTIRRPIQDYGISSAASVRKLWWLISRDHPKCQINISQDIIETTCTPHPSLAGTLLPSGPKKSPPYFRFLPLQIREHLHRRYLIDAIELAAETNSHIHLWTHLHNIANDSQWRAIKPALDYLGGLQRQGELEVHRMRDLPDVVL